MKHFNSRRQKVEYLRHLLAGKASLLDLHQKHRIKHWHNRGDGIWRDENGNVATYAEMNDARTHNIFHVHSQIAIAQSEEEIIF